MSLDAPQHCLSSLRNTPCPGVPCRPRQTPPNRPLEEKLTSAGALSRAVLSSFPHTAGPRPLASLLLMARCAWWLPPAAPAGTPTEGGPFRMMVVLPPLSPPFTCTFQANVGRLSPAALSLCTPFECGLCRMKLVLHHHQPHMHTFTDGITHRPPPPVFRSSPAYLPSQAHPLRIVSSACSWCCPSNTHTLPKISKSTSAVCGTATYCVPTPHRHSL